MTVIKSFVLIFIYAVLLIFLKQCSFRINFVCVLIHIIKRISNTSLFLLSIKAYSVIELSLIKAMTNVSSTPVTDSFSAFLIFRFSTAVLISYDESISTLSQLSAYESSEIPFFGILNFAYFSCNTVIRLQLVLRTTYCKQTHNN